MSRSGKYKITHGEEARFEGTIARDPKEKSEITMAALSCNSNKDRGDRDEYVRNINALDPDIIFFRFWHHLDSILGASGRLFQRRGATFVACSFPMIFG